MTLYDIIVIEYMANDPPFSNSDIQNIQKYINQGGSFYVNGQTWTWEYYGRGVNSSLTIYGDYFPNILLVKLGVAFPYDWCTPTILPINPPDSMTSVCLASNNTCCSPTCGTNLYVSNEATIVSNCPNGFYGDNVTNLCATTCSDGYWGDITTNLCNLCDSSCLTCNGPSSSNCISCLQTIWLAGQCVSNCPLSDYYIATSNTCGLCDSSCQTCTGPTNVECLTCPTGYYILSHSCHLCDQTCLTCDGSYNSDCLSCLPNLVLTSKRCLCPSGMYNSSNPWPNICLNCSNACVSCFGPSSSNCSSCPNGLVLSNSQCLLACPMSTYFDGEINMCTACDDSCSECFGQLSNQCISCQNTSFFHFQGTCFNECPTGSYMAFDKNNNNICLSVQIINVASTSLYENHLYSVQFFKKWDELLINFPNYINVSISGMSERDYSYDIQNLTNDTYYGFTLYFNYTVESIPNNSVLTLLLNINHSNYKNMYVLSNNKFSFDLSIFCPASYIIKS